MKIQIAGKKILKSASLIFIAALFVVQTSTPASAANLIDLINRGVNYYIPGDVCNTVGTDIPADSTLPQDVIQGAAKNKGVYEAAASQVDLPWQVLAGIHYRESAFNTSRDLQAGNPYGGPYPMASTSYAKFGYPANFEESVVIAGKELQDKAMAGIFKKNITTSAIDAELIKDALFGYNGRAEVYKQQAARLGFDPEKQPYEGSPYVMSRYDAKHTDMQIITSDHGPLDGIDKRFGAFAVYALLGGPLSGGGDSGSCNGAAAGIGDLNNIVLSYAWHEWRGRGYTTRKPEYIAAVNAGDAKGEYHGGCNGVDCGAFVMRVVRDSKIDPNYNEYMGVTDDQWRYMRDHPELYENVTSQIRASGDSNNSSGAFKPGDIAIDGGHTYMFVGEIPGFGGKVASASLCNRAPMASNLSEIGRYQWFRPKGTGALPINGPTPE